MKQIYQQCQAIIDPSLPWISNVSNILAILYHEIPSLNWVGLYFADPCQQICFLGPFQGKVACTKIPYGKGVVGTCAMKKTKIVVKDVHDFPGHIACDSRSKSEIVIPIRDREGRVFACLDIDSDKLNAFDAEDEEGLNKILGLLYS